MQVDCLEVNPGSTGRGIGNMKWRREKLMEMEVVTPVGNGLNPIKILRKNVEIAPDLFHRWVGILEYLSHDSFQLLVESCALGFCSLTVFHS